MECLRRVAYVLSSVYFKLPASSTKSHVYISYSETSTDMYIARVDGFRNSEITFTKILELYYSSSVYLFSVGFMQSSIYSAEMFSRVFYSNFDFRFELNPSSNFPIALLKLDSTSLSPNLKLIFFFVETKFDQNIFFKQKKKAINAINANKWAFHHWVNVYLNNTAKHRFPT